MHLLQKNRTRGQKGYSLAMWAAVFAVVVAAFFLIRTPLKRALQGKIMATTDYMFWTKWGQDTRQYKGEDTSFVRTDTTQNVSATQSEKDKYINYNVDSTVSEGTISSSVEDGSQPVLRTLDFNTIQGNINPPPIVVPPGGGLPDVPTDGSSAQEAFHTCFHGQMERTPMPAVGEVNGIARTCAGLCRGSCQSYTASQEQGCWSGCANYCVALCSTLPSEYRQSCESGCE